MRVGNAFGICHASHIRNEGFIRFCVAHELGHYFLDGHIDAIFSGGHRIHESTSGFVSDDRFERQADQFAAALLMPKGLFVQAIEEAEFGFPAIEQLKRDCRTSITATAIRYAQFTHDPVAVLISSGTSIDYCVVSDPLSEVPGVGFVPKGALVPPQSCTAKFNRQRHRVKRGEHEVGWASLDDWFDGAAQIEMKEDVVGLGGYGKTLTVLFSDEVIDMDLDE